jgi:hypothetical protein
LALVSEEVFPAFKMMQAIVEPDEIATVAQKPGARG